MLEPTWQTEDGSVKLWLADCLDVLPQLEAGSVDAVVTDPPYGVGLGNHLAAKDRRTDRVLVKDGYDSYEDTPENYDAIVVPAITKALSMAKTGRGLVFGVPPSIWALPAPTAMGGVYLPSACGRNTWGFSSLVHALLYGRAPNLQLGAKHTAIRSTDTSEKNGHPCPKPLSWMRWAIHLASADGETILDPFMGSGTTGVACVRTGRRFIGIEKEPRYFEIARKRIQAELERHPLLEAAPKVVQKELI